MESALAYKVRGNELYQSGKCAEALVEYAKGVQEIVPLVEKVTEAKQLAVVLYSNMAQMCLTLKQWDDAVKYAELSLDLDPSHEKSLYRHQTASTERQNELNRQQPKPSTMNFAGPGPQGDLVMRAMTEGVQLNNMGCALNNEHKYHEALPYFQKSLEIKAAAYGQHSKHYLITLSGVADAYLGMNELDLAETNAKNMLDIATQLGEKDQARIAREILGDIEKKKKRKR